MSEAVYLTSERAKQAIALAEPSIAMMMQTVTNRKALHIVVVGLDGRILFERSVGPDVVADEPRLAICREIARSKAQIHFRTGRPSAEVQARRPHTLVIGDTIHGGSAAYEGITVGASGVQGYFDESISGMVAAILWGLCVDAQSAHLAKSDKPHHHKNSV